MLQIHNTLTRQKETFEPIEPGHIRMYVCGMTVYDFCHLGHARVLVAFDVIVRYLRALGYQVTYVRNITDIDDKILDRARDNQEPWQALTERFISAMHQDEGRLGVQPPTLEPTATSHLQAMIDMIGTLMEGGYAYQAGNGDVYYRVTRFPDYGRLSGKRLDELLAGARVEVDEAKEDPRDFALWKAVAGEGDVGWDSPWGRGRPGWHIECSAMSTHALGNTFDIHGGGPDLRFPHHENEIAQSEAATGEPYARFWMHTGAVRVDDEKMSKSLGNFFTIREVLENHHPEVVRYLLIASHYRSDINYTRNSLNEARGALERFYTALRDYADVAPLDGTALAETEAFARFRRAMDDDFNTREAMAVMFELVRELNSLTADDGEKARPIAATLKALGGILGLLQYAPDSFLQAGARGALASEVIEAKIAERRQAKQDRDYARADAIRDELREQGVVLEDSREGTSWRRE